jgi:two-component system cell cycle response regulator
MSATILVVDDEASNREVIQAALVLDGYRVDVAEDGPTALERASRVTPDLILLDLLMPRMDGLEVCRRLKDGPTTADVPIIVITALGEMTVKEAALISGADDFMTKPFRADDLRARVAAMLKVRRLRQELDRTLTYLHELEAVRRAQRQTALRNLVVPDLARPASTGRSIAVLLVDDEALTRDFYADLLVEHGFQVFAAASGPEALEIVGRERMETALVDIRMPEMSGLAVLERLRSLDATLPVMMLTAHPSSQIAIAALKLGAFDFLVKGLDHTLVVMAVHRAVRHRRELLERDDEIRQLKLRVAELEKGPGR